MGHHPRRRHRWHLARVGVAVVSGEVARGDEHAEALAGGDPRRGGRERDLVALNPPWPEGIGPIGTVAVPGSQAAVAEVPGAAAVVDDAQLDDPVRVDRVRRREHDGIERPHQLEVLLQGVGGEHQHVGSLEHRRLVDRTTRHAARTHSRPPRSGTGRRGRTRSGSDRRAPGASKPEAPVGVEEEPRRLGRRRPRRQRPPAVLALDEHLDRRLLVDPVADPLAPPVEPPHVERVQIALEVERHGVGPQPEVEIADDVPRTRRASTDR